MCLNSVLGFPQSKIPKAMIVMKKTVVMNTIFIFKISEFIYLSNSFLSPNKLFVKNSKSK